jgi:hypothetical protein
MYRVYQYQTDCNRCSIGGPLKGEWTVQQQDTYGYWRDVSIGYAARNAAVAEMDTLNRGKTMTVEVGQRYACKHTVNVWEIVAVKPPCEDTGLVKIGVIRVYPLNAWDKGHTYWWITECLHHGHELLTK